MNVLIVDLDKVSVDVLNIFINSAVEITNEDFIVLPKGVDILQDVPVEWLKAIRDKLDENIKALESDEK